MLENPERFSWRHAVPLTVRLHRSDANGNREDLIIPSELDAITKFPSLNTAVGLVYGKEFGTDQCVVVWEHRLIRASYKGLQNILKTRHGNVGEHISHAMPRRVIWIFPEDTAVRPRLPERSAIINNTDWQRALEALTDSLVQIFNFDHVIEAVQAYAGTLPPVLLNGGFPGMLAWRNLPSNAESISALNEAGNLHPFLAPEQNAWLRWGEYPFLHVMDTLWIRTLQITRKRLTMLNFRETLRPYYGLYLSYRDIARALRTHHSSR